MARTCIFCGSDRELTREHAWPAWLGDHFNTRFAFRKGFRLTSDQWGQRISDRRVKGLDLTVNRVCAECNNGWMSRLETDARPLLSPLIEGKHRAIWSDEQAIISTWLVKTAMVFEFTADSSREPFYTDEERRRVRSERAIPPSTIILLGAYRGDAYQGFAQDRDLNVQCEGRSSYRRYVKVFSIGHLLMFAISDGVRENMAEVRWPDDQDLKETWVSIRPSRGPQTWPPKRIFETSELTKLSTVLG